MADVIQAVYDEKTARIAGRFTKDVDLFGGIKDVCRRFGVTAGQFQCIGSLAHATFVQIEKTSEGILQYSPKVQTKTPVEILSGSGFIGFNEKGDLDVHFHGMTVDCNGNINGGHFLDGENPVAITIEFVIFVLPGMRLERGIDPTWNMPVFQFYKKE